MSMCVYIYIYIYIYIYRERERERESVALQNNIFTFYNFALYNIVKSIYNENIYIYAHNYLIIKLIKYKCPVTDKYKIEKKTIKFI